MSSRRSRTLKVSDGKIDELFLKLQSLLPQLNQGNNSKIPAWKVLEDTCNYIRRLHTEVDDLGERLSRILDSVDTTDLDLETLRTLLQG